MERKKKITGEQKNALVSAMEADSQLNAGRMNTLEGRKTYKRKWSDLANELNAVPYGVTKSISEWQKAWAQLKAKVKKKKTEARSHARGTGGGPASNPTLSEVEERIVSLIGVGTIEGLDVDELGAQTYTAFLANCEEQEEYFQNIDEDNSITGDPFEASSPSSGVDVDTHLDDEAGRPSTPHSQTSSASRSTTRRKKEEDRQRVDTFCRQNNKIIKTLSRGILERLDEGNNILRGIFSSLEKISAAAEKLAEVLKD